MLDGPTPLSDSTHHITRRILKKNQRRVTLVTQLNELRRFGRACRLNGSVVAKNANQMPLYPGVTTNCLTGVPGLELQKIRAINQPCNNFPYIIGFAVVCRNNAEQFLLVVQRLDEGRLRQDWGPFQFIE